MRRVIPPLLICALALLAVSPALVGGRGYIGGDLLLYFYPFRETLARGLAEGALPAWDPSTGCGTPFCADPQAICFDPAALFYAAAPLHAAFAAEVALRLALAGLGTVAFLRGRRVEADQALLFGAATALGGVAVSLIGRTDKLGAFAMLPWTFAAVDAVAARRPWGGPALILAFALGGTSGGLEVWAMAIAGAFFWALAAPSPEEPAAGGRARTLGFTALSLAGALALTAIQWLPFAAFLRGSSRGGGLSYEAATEISAHPARLLGLVLPELFYDPGALQGRLHPGAPGAVHYVAALAPGWITLVFAARALHGADPRARAARLLGALSGAVLLLGLGRHLPGYHLLFDVVPGFSLWRYPEKFLIPLGFSLPAMAGLAAAPTRGGPLWRGLVGVGLLAAALGAALGGALAPSIAAWGAGALGGSGASWLGWSQRVGGGLAAHGLALALGALALSAGRWRLALAPLALDLLLVHAGVNPTGPAALVGPGPAASALPANSRIEAFSAAMGASMFVVPSGSLEARLAGFRAGLYPDMGVLDGLRHTDSVRAIRPEPTARLFRAAERGGDPARYLRFLELSGTDVAVSTRAQEEALLSAWPGARRIGTQASTGVSLWALEGAAPRLYRTERATTWPTISAAIGALAEGRQDARASVALLDEQADPARAVEGLSGVAGWSDGELTVSLDAPDHLELTTTGSGSGWVVALETWDPGWRATVDGAEARIFRAQGAFMAVPVPAGDAAVSLRYEAPGRALGGWISLGAALGLSCLGLGSWRRRALRTSSQSPR